MNAYNAYRPLRLVYLAAHPLCELCYDLFTENEDGTVGRKIKAAEQVHHIRPILTGNTPEEMKELATDMKNLMSLCEWHHERIHHRIPEPRTIDNTAVDPRFLC